MNKDIENVEHPGELSLSGDFDQAARDELSGYFDKKLKSKFFKPGHMSAEAANTAWMETSGHFYEEASLCHSYFEPSKPRYIIDVQGRTCRPKTNLAYLEWLYGSKSPYHALWETCALLRNREQIFGIVCKHPDKTSAHLLANIFIAGRCKTAWALDRAWENLVTAGFSKPVAYILTQFYHWGGPNQDDRGYNYAHQNPKLFSEGPFPYKHTRVPVKMLGGWNNPKFLCSWESPFHTMNGFSPRSFIQGKPKKGKAFGTGYGIMACNGIWDHTNSIGYSEIGKDQLALTSMVNGEAKHLGMIQEIQDAFENDKEIQV